MSALVWVPVAGLAFLAMEPWSRFAHRDLWHGPLAFLHDSHHQPSGRFELNDLFAVAHAVPAASLVIYGCIDTSLVGQVAFGVGAGMTAFGASYAIVHDGLVHGRLPVGFLARIPWLRRVRNAHRAHHLTGGAPYGLFRGPQELRRERDRARGRAAPSR